MKQNIHEQVQAFLDRTLLISDLARAFDKTPQTILNWVKYDGLPCVSLPGERCTERRFAADAVMQWARAHNKKLVVDLQELTRKRAANAERVTV